MDNSHTSTPPPGWYPDPGGGGQRFWNGAQWTVHVRPLEAQASPATASAMPAAGWYPNPAGPGVRYWTGCAWTGAEIEQPLLTQPAGTEQPLITPAGTTGEPMLARSAVALIALAPPPPLNESRRRRARRMGHVSLALLRKDPRLVIFPLVSTLISVVIGAASFGTALLLTGAGQHSRSVLFVGAMIASYPLTFVTLFCGVALACMLGRILAGEEPTPSAGWQDARQRAGIIAQWTLLVCTVGVVLRVLEQRLPLGGKLAAWLVGLSWGLATLFAVPVIAYERLTPGATLRRSSELFRQRWGSQVGGTLVIGVGSALVAVPVILAIVAGIFIRGPQGLALIALGGGALLALQAFSLALNQVYRIFLYRDAVGAPGRGGPFSPGDLQQPFGKRRLG